MAKKRGKKGKTILFSIIVVFLGFIIYALMGGFDEEQLMRVETAIVSSQDITELVSASGKIQPEEEVVIRSDVSGEIIELAVREGDYVEQGDLLLRIKPDIYQARVDELEATLLTQKARLKQTESSAILAEQEYLRQKSLYEKQAVSELDYLQAKANYESNVASLEASSYQIQSAEAQLREAQEQLDLTIIRSPRDGSISKLDVEKGDRVLGNTQMAGTAIMSVAQLDAMEVQVDVNENDIVNVSVGDMSTIEVDAYTDRTFEGVVTEIANSAIISGGGSNEEITNYVVKIRITTPHNLRTQRKNHAIVSGDEYKNLPIPAFKTGMSATVDVATKSEKMAISVPIQAIASRKGLDKKQPIDDNSLKDKDERNSSEESTSSLNRLNEFQKVVFVVENNIVKQVEVSTGLSNQTHIQVLTGLTEGEEVVIGSYNILANDLQDGDEVVVSNEYYQQIRDRASAQRRTQ